MSVPILKQGAYLVANIQSALMDLDLRDLQREILEKVGMTRAQGVIIDVSVLDVIDSFATRTLQALARAVQLRGATMVIAGIQPEVAFAMVQMGLDLKNTPTVIDLEDAFSLLYQRTAGNGITRADSTRK
jgi:rsbT antagonist protein RsbS